MLPLLPTQSPLFIILLLIMNLTTPFDWWLKQSQRKIIYNNAIILNIHDLRSQNTYKKAIIRYYLRNVLQKRLTSTYMAAKKIKTITFHLNWLFGNVIEITGIFSKNENLDDDYMCWRNTYKNREKGSTYATLVMVKEISKCYIYRNLKGGVFRLSVNLG